MSYEQSYLFDKDTGSDFNFLRQKNRNKEYFVPFPAMKKLKAVMSKHMEDQAENILLLIHGTCLWVFLQYYNIVPCLFL